MAGEAQSARGEWRRHWPLVIASMFGMSVYTVVSYSLGTFIEPLETEFGWSRAQISSGLTIFTLTAVIGAPLMGAAIDRFGTRRIAVGGLFLYALALSSFSLANGSYAQWLLLWTIFALLALSIKSVVWSAAVSSVFVNGRGMAIAVVLSGTAISQTLAPYSAAVLIDNFGWRMAYVLIGLGWGGFTLGLVLAFFFDARELGKAAASAGPKAPAAARPGGLTLREALHDQRILRIAAAEVFFSAIASGVMIHMVPILSDAGVDRSRAVEIAALAGIAGITGKLLAGWLLDKVQGSAVPFTSFAVQALGYFLLLNLFGSLPLLMLGVGVVGFTVGASLQVTTYLISRYAGLRNFGKIFGGITSMMMVGASIGPLLAGYIFDTQGSYTPLLTGAIPVALACSMLFLWLGPYPDYANES
jgi:predicted MFS family arabinose efflux permease